MALGVLITDVECSLRLYSKIKDFDCRPLTRLCGLRPTVRSSPDKIAPMKNAKFSRP